MQPDQLLETIKSTLQKHKVIELAKIAAANQHAIKEIIDLTFYPDQQIAFRAAWILENIYTQYQAYFLPYLTYFLERFDVQHHPSAQRHYAKIAAMLTSKKASPFVKSSMQQIQTEQLITTTFNWLIDPNTPVAIKSHCLNILANLSPTNPWVKDELLQTIDFLIDQESVAFYAKAKQVRKQLGSKR